MTDTSMTYMQFLLNERRRSESDRDLMTLLHGVATACKAISNSLKNGALADVLGSLESENVQGETQKKLDVIANDIFLRRCEFSGVLAAMVSEELEEIYQIPERFPKGQYVLFFDPLDGSSNIDINVSVGSIFSILRLPEVPDVITYETVLRPGVEQVAAGYALYGPSTMLVLSIGRGVDGFTLDGNIGEFRHTHSSISIPPEAAEFSINASRAQWWEPPVKRYIDDCVAGENGPRGKYFNMRWIASMVAEVHRILLRGGIFLYPIDERNSDAGGKLRLFYEANPMAFLIEQAGGAASTGRERILDVQPLTPHQRVPVILGSRDEVELVERLHKEYDEASRSSVS
ncbi:class 1 fructose-bisphosphatase [Alphaproteobacteria bacterium GH1-50]|uniref:Fructose-1,6-bisphosphatase class 1 n=1 Tax=Kangsaoukella pontilimi TaxID=2691042 RepID=A0A7C9M8C8_9RHOB|nr:class 1 fructose-bisphosphatase [Kangsaoukella pontilimi]MXQ06593.1 class 1 fructose-bisphosphatase [Kangsaoukella pontilimi]